MPCYLSRGRTLSPASFCYRGVGCMSRAKIHSFVCLIVLFIAQSAWAQPVAEKKDTAFKTVTGPSDFFKKSQPKKPDTTTSVMGSVSVAMPKIEYFNLKPGNKEGMPPGLYATFIPPVPDTVKVYEGGTPDYVTIETKSNKEVIHGDSVSILFEVDRRKASYEGKPKPVKKGKTNSMITRSGFIPSQGFGTNRYRFAVTPSHFVISPGALITASVHILGSEKTMGTILCSVTQIDFANNTFYIETSNEVPEGEHINWVIINFPE
jgi:hypothetical protein